LQRDFRLNTKENIENLDMLLNPIPGMEADYSYLRRDNALPGQSLTKTRRSFSLSEKWKQRIPSYLSV